VFREVGDGSPSPAAGAGALVGADEDRAVEPRESARAAAEREAEEAAEADKSADADKAAPPSAA